ncbi:phenylalanine--tRNA ligase subunit beta [Tepidiforma sp.]|uniref:phenylalanine--tRNA ligase subunit beta n=1 Tax=Tepidiforma sp. TaxID=2682230 RepID=UPI002ADD3647|nr:phenylalanine--tRNA ligase subunit beta [Tepidiforma sp.]
MKVSLNWLREYVNVRLPVEELTRRITDATAEVEGWRVIGEGWDPERVRVALVVGVDPHPNADRLRLATVETGQGRVQVVCGAPNLAVGQKVAFASEGARLIDGHTGEPTVLKLRPIRGVESAGMVLSEKELGLSDDHEGILVLPADAPVGVALADVLGDVILEVSTWANRADLLGMVGFAREVAALTGEVLREPPLTYTESGPAVEELVSVRVEAPDLCRRFTASVIEGLTIGPSPEWIQERLRKAGMRPINNVVDITNYVMLETGQPLHAFDFDLVRGRQIVARRAKEGERLVTLDGVERVLDGEMLVICDGEGPVGIAGVMGGGNSEVHEGTTRVLLEVANFRAGSIRRTSTLLKLRTEASLRFEKGIGPEMALYAQRRALHLFETVCGGRIAKGVVDVYPGKEPPRTVVLDGERLERVLGIAVPPDEVRRILTDLGFAVHHVPPARFSVQVPPWRPDVEIPDDVVEEVGRIYGYDKLPATTLRGTLPPMEENPAMALREQLRDLAAALGFQEVITYTLTTREKLALVTDPADTVRRNPLGVVNPVSSQHAFLRTSMRSSVLEVYAANRRQAEGPLRLFEVGYEYLPVEGDLPYERPVLCGVLGGAREGRWAVGGGDALDFFDAKGVVEAMLRAVGVRGSFVAAEEFGLLPGHTAKFGVGPEMVGVVGQVHPETAAAFDIEEPVFLFEIWVHDLVRHLPERPAYQPLSRFPAVRLDLAIVVDAAVPAGAVLELARSHRSNGVRVAAELFDEYRGPGVGEGKKSLALRLWLRADDRTLTDEEAMKVRQGLLARLGREFGAELRGQGAGSR